jgi:Flp pilus assembly protein TadG
MRVPRLFIRRQRGAVAIMVALSMVMLLAIIGLVVDGGLAYMVKARLNAAVDSAALAGARAVPVGNNQAEQIASAQGAAADFFAANIPANYLLSKPTLLSTNVSFNAGTATIDVRAEAPMPVSFMQVLGFSSLKPVAYAQTIRKDLDMMLVVDTSGSLSASGAGVRTATTTFLNAFNVTQDRVGLIHFASGIEVDNPIPKQARGFDRPAMLKNVTAFNFKGGTSSVEGVWHARNQLNQIASSNRSSMRVIVFFSDGAPTSFGTTLTFAKPLTCSSSLLGAIDSVGQGLFDLTVSENALLAPSACNFTSANIATVTKKLPDWYNANGSDKEFPIVTGASARRGAVTSDLTNADVARRNIDRAARNLVEAVAAKARDEGIFVFTLGLGSGLKETGDYDPEVNENVLKCMANVADGPASCYNAAKPVGMYCYAATTADLTPCFSRLASAILRISK